MNPNRRGAPWDFMVDVAYGVQRDLFLDDWGQALLRTVALGCADDAIRGMIQERVNYVRVLEMFDQIPPFRRARLTKGEILLGGDWDMTPEWFPVQSLCSGLGLGGGTGSGKSNAWMWIAPQIAHCGVSVWMAEMYKTQLRQLRPIFQRLGKELVILPARYWKANLLQPGRRNPHFHLTMAIDLLNRILDVGERGQAILWQAAYALYDKYNVWSGTSREFPCLFDLYELVYDTPGLNVAAKEAILDRLGALLVFGRCFAYRTAWDPVDLEKCSVVFEMQGTTEHLKQMLIEPCLYAVFQHAYECGRVNAPASLVIALEDCQRFLNSSQSTFGALPRIDELAAVTRGGGKALCPIFQTTHGLSRSLMANMTTKITGRMSIHEDYQVVGADMGQTAEQLLWARRNQRPGVFIGQTGEGDWHEPFILRVPKVTLRETVDDVEAAASRKVLDSLPTVPAREFDHWKPHHLIEVTSAPAAPALSLSDAELRFLQAVVAEPGKASGFYARQAGMNGRRAAVIRARLVAEGYVREHRVATGPRGRAAIVLEPLPAAHAVVAGSSGGGRP